MNIISNVMTILLVIPILLVMVTGIVAYIFLKLYNIKKKKYIEKQKEKVKYQLKYNWSNYEYN